MALLSARRSAYLNQDEIEQAAGKLKILSELEEAEDKSLAYFAAATMCRIFADGELINSPDDLIVLWKTACFGEPRPKRFER